MQNIRYYLPPTLLGIILGSLAMIGSCYLGWWSCCPSSPSLSKTQLCCPPNEEIQSEGITTYTASITTIESAGIKEVINRFSESSYNTFNNRKFQYIAKDALNNSEFGQFDGVYFEFGLSDQKIELFMRGVKYCDNGIFYSNNIYRIGTDGTISNPPRILEDIFYPEKKNYHTGVTSPANYRQGYFIGKKLLAQMVSDNGKSGFQIFFGLNNDIIPSASTTGAGKLHLIFVPANQSDVINVDTDLNSMPKLYSTTKNGTDGPDDVLPKIKPYPPM